MCERAEVGAVVGLENRGVGDVVVVSAEEDGVGWSEAVPVDEGDGEGRVEEGKAGEQGRAVGGADGAADEVSAEEGDVGGSAGCG